MRQSDDGDDVKAPDRPARRIVPVSGEGGWHRWRGRALAALVGVGFVALIEGVLWLADAGPSHRLFEPRSGVDGVESYQINPQAAYRFFPPHLLRRVPADQDFAAHKPEGTVRIFALGASTLVGFPNPVGTGFPDFLERILNDLYPERRFEVINGGITALSSICLIDFAEEVVGYDADVLILYTGHNEFVGPFGPTTPFARVGSRRDLIRGVMHLKKARLYWLLEEVASRVSRWVRPEGDEGFGLHLVRDEISLHDPAYDATVENYGTNLEDIADRAAAAGVPLLAGMLVSNMRDFYPLASDCRTNDEKGAVGGLAGLTASEALLRDHPECAAAHFELGQIHERAGRYREARQAFVLARDLDRLPFRAPSALNRRIDNLGRRRGVVVSNLDSAFTAAAQHGIPGNDLFTEYLHPTGEGHFLIAQTMVRDLVAGGIAAAWGRQRPGLVRDFDSYRALLGLTPLKAVLHRNDLILLLGNMPYHEPPRLLRQRLAELVDEQLKAFSRLSPRDREVFRKRGGLEFLRQVVPEVTQVEQDGLAARLERLAGGPGSGDCL